MSELEVTFLGTGGTAPSAERGMPATMIKYEGDKWLFDCGEGTQRQLWKADGGLTDVDGIFLTHYHSDHILGLPGLLNSYQLRGRTRPLHIFGPAPLDKNLRRFRELMGRATYNLIEMHELDPGSIVNRKGYRIRTISATHAHGQALAYVLEEDERPGRFDVAKAKSLGVHPGPDFGKLQAGHTVRGVQPADVIGPTRAGRKVVLTGDTAPSTRILEAARGADLLIHEATFLERDTERVEATEHSTAKQAAILAKNAGVAKLALYHISSRHGKKFIQREAWSAFMGALVPDDFDKIVLPVK